VVTNVMVEDPIGHRTLYAPILELAEFLTAAYRFHDVQAVAQQGSTLGGDRAAS
jgi:hypothetical protein